MAVPVRRSEESGMQGATNEHPSGPSSSQMNGRDVVQITAGPSGQPEPAVFAYSHGDIEDPEPGVCPWNPGYSFGERHYTSTSIDFSIGREWRRRIGRQLVEGIFITIKSVTPLIQNLLINEGINLETIVEAGKKGPDFTSNGHDQLKKVWAVIQRHGVIESDADLELIEDLVAAGDWLVYQSQEMDVDDTSAGS